MSKAARVAESSAGRAGELCRRGRTAATGCSSCRARAPLRWLAHKADRIIGSRPHSTAAEGRLAASSGRAAASRGPKRSVARSARKPSRSRGPSSRSATSPSEGARGRPRAGHGRRASMPSPPWSNPASAVAAPTVRRAAVGGRRRALVRRSHCRTNPREANPPPRSRRVAPTAQAEQSPKEFNRTIRTRRRALHSQQPDRGPTHTLAPLVQTGVHRSRSGLGTGGGNRPCSASEGSEPPARSTTWPSSRAGSRTTTWPRARPPGAGSLTAASSWRARSQAEDLRALLAGRDPHTDDQLVRGPAGRPRTPGFDLTFSAPKSVSLLYALGDPELKAQAIEAHERAVGAAIGYLEQHAAFLRRGRAGAQRVPAVGLVAAGFRHRASRAGDPALHTHVLVANLGQDDEGRFGALDSRAIYRAARTAGYLYQAELRHQLSSSLGVRVGRGDQGGGRDRGRPAGGHRRLQRPPGGDHPAHGGAGRERPAGGRGGGPGHPPGQGAADRARPVRRLGRPGAGARLRAAPARGDPVARPAARAGPRRDRAVLEELASPRA